MHDLRKQVLLESGKTVSRKARSKQASGVTSQNGSPSGSRNASRAASRNASDDEDEFSDGTEWRYDQNLLATDEPQPCFDCLCLDESCFGLPSRIQVRRNKCGPFIEEQDYHTNHPLERLCQTCFPKQV